MLRGDISNESPRRWMVTQECLLDQEMPFPKKSLFKSWDTIARNTSWEPLSLGRIWQASNRYGIQFEMLVFGHPLEYCEALEKNLERLGVHPIVWVTRFQHRAEAAKKLAYRPDVQAVIDTPEKHLTWGNRGMTLNQI